MKCSLCQKDNEPGSWFCAFCGAPLQPLERLNTVYREVQRLTKAVTSMDERLAALERERGAPTSKSSQNRSSGPAAEPPHPTEENEVTE